MLDNRPVSFPANSCFPFAFPLFIASSLRLFNPSCNMNLKLVLTKALVRHKGHNPNSIHHDISQRIESSQLQDSSADKCSNHSLLQFQLKESSVLTQNQLLHQAQSQQALVHGFQGNQNVAQNQWQNCHPYNEQQFHPQTQLPHLEKLRHLFSDQHQIPKVIATMGLVGTQQIFSNTITTSTPVSEMSPMHSLLSSYSQDGGTCHFTLPGSNLMVSSTSLGSKRMVIEPQLSFHGTQCSVPKVGELGEPQTKMSELSSLLPPLSGREFHAYQAVGDPQNNLLFAANMQHIELSNLQSNENENISLSIPFSRSTFPSAMGTDFPPDSYLTTTSCLDESGLIHSSENVDYVNPPAGTFVKIHKSGSFGRSLDISKVSSYHELRGELAHLFALEGELEDPLRSGWQLVFVDHENDVLLLGDDPWQEFVNNVWYIKVLSPQEAQQMGKEGRNLSNSISRANIPNGLSSCNDFIDTQDMRNSRNGVASVTSRDY